VTASATGTGVPQQLLTKDNVSSVIIGANTTEQLADSLGATGLRLTGDEMTALDGLSD